MQVGLEAEVGIEFKSLSTSISIPKDDYFLEYYIPVLAFGAMVSQ